MAGENPIFWAYLLFEGQIFLLDRLSTTIGRGLQNDVILHKPYISRDHAKLTFDGDRFSIEDLGSANGTFVNGHHAGRKTSLQSGDVISLANYPLTFIQNPDALEARVNIPTEELDDEDRQLEAHN